MPLPSEFEGKGVFGSSACFWKNCSPENSEPNSVLDTIRSHSPSSSTLSSSLGCGGAAAVGGGGVAAVAGNSSVKWHQEAPSTTSSNVGYESELQPVPPSLEMVGGSVGGGAVVEEWESVMPDSVAASPSQEQSILRWIMGDVDDPSMANLNKVLQIGSGGGGPTAAEYEFNTGFGVVDQGFGVADQGISFTPNNGGGSKFSNAQNPIIPVFPGNLGGGGGGGGGGPMVAAAAAFAPPQLMQQQRDEAAAMFSPQMLINQHQIHPQSNPSFFMPLAYGQQENMVVPPQAKRHNPGQPMEMAKLQFSDHHHHPQQLYKQQEMGVSHQQQQGIIDQLYKAAELVQSGNPLLAQSILARLNHQLSPVGKPFYRAAFYCKEALQMLLHNNNTSNNDTSSSPFSLVFKIGAYKSFSEISPIIQFANFTCIQALLEVLEGYDHIHIVDFDIGYGGQWASFMQELALRSGGAPSLKITAFASSSTHDQLELGLMRDNLMHFASEISMPFEFEILSVEAVNSSASWGFPLHVSENEAVAVNLPVSSFSNCQLSLPVVLRFVRQLGPKIVVSVDRGCDRTDLPFSNHVIHALQSYSNLLESLDAVNLNLDSLQKIERFLLQPGLERIISGRYRTQEKTPHWRNLFLSSGFSPIAFSNFTESQAECVVKRTPVRGFHVEKRQSSIVLCWQRKELISASAWRC